MASKAKHAERSHYNYQRKASNMSGYVRRTGSRAKSIATAKVNDSLVQMLKERLSNLAPNKNDKEEKEKDAE